MLTLIQDRGIRSFVREVVALARAEQLTLVAAGVAFYAFISLIPIALLALAVMTVVDAEQLAEGATTAMSDILTPSAQELVAEMLTDDTGRGGATLVGIGGLLWSGSRVLRGLDRAFSEIYGTVERKSSLRNVRDSIVVTVAIVLGLVALAGIEAILRATTTGIFEVVAPIFLFVTLLAAFLPMYIVFPDANVLAAEALPGAAFAALGWTLLTRVFSIYADIAGTYALYGALGAVFLVLTWLYVGSMLIVFGATVNAVLDDRHVDRRQSADRQSDVDRQLQSHGPRQFSTEAMTEDATGPDEESDVRSSTRSRTRDRSDDPAVLREELERLRESIEAVEDDVDRRTVHRDSLEGELKRYVRRRVRRGHAHGWGPYLVLLYGTAMTIAAFYFLSSAWAVLAMFVIWTSTLGVFFLMVLVGAGLSLLNIPGRIRNRIGEWRS